MTYTITRNCIGCQRCLSACSTGAIKTNGSTFWIEANLCNQCADSHGVPQCWSVCPTNEGCVPLTEGATAISLTSKSEASPDYWESWFATYTRMVARLKASEASEASQQSSYWRPWFDTYAQALQNLQTTHSPSGKVALTP